MKVKLNVCPRNEVEMIGDKKYNSIGNTKTLSQKSSLYALEMKKNARTVIKAPASVKPKNPQFEKIA